MGWATAPESKVAWCGDESISEGPLPETVGDHAVGEGVVFMCNPVCQGEATVGFRGRDVRQVRVEHLQGGKGTRCERITDRAFRFPSFMYANGLHRLVLDHAIKFGRRTQVFKLLAEFPNQSLSILRYGQVLPVLLLERRWGNHWISKTNLIHRIPVFPVGGNEGKKLTVCRDCQIDCLEVICSGDLFKRIPRSSHR